MRLKRLTWLVVLAAILCVGVYADRSLLVLAGRGTAEEVQSAIHRGANVNWRGTGGLTPLLSAAFRNPNPGVFLSLISAGADVNARSDDGWTPLMLVLYGNPNSDAIAPILIRAGANVNVVRKEFGVQTPLIVAVQRNRNPEVIEMLLNAGADINARTDSGWTPLMFAARDNPNPKIVQTLLNAGADVNLRDYRGWTPLIVAVRRNPNPAVIEMLLDSGADGRLEDREGKTAFDHTKENGRLVGTDIYWRLNDAQYYGSFFWLVSVL